MASDLSLSLNLDIIWLLSVQKLPQLHFENWILNAKRENEEDFAKKDQFKMKKCYEYNNITSYVFYDVNC